MAKKKSVMSGKRAKVRREIEKRLWEIWRLVMDIETPRARRQFAKEVSEFSSTNCAFISAYAKEFLLRCIEESEKDRALLKQRKKINARAGEIANA